uniref:Uncharacterized protein n=1 Tax=Anguilla anguilla TaxID=7936 RepID=A0A0E9UHK9_ANGAN
MCNSPMNTLCKFCLFNHPHLSSIMCQPGSQLPYKITREAIITPAS